MDLGVGQVAELRRKDGSLQRGQRGLKLRCDQPGRRRASKCDDVKRYDWQKLACKLNFDI